MLSNHTFQAMEACRGPLATPDSSSSLVQGQGGWDISNHNFPFLGLIQGHGKRTTHSMLKQPARLQQTCRMHHSPSRYAFRQAAVSRCHPAYAWKQHRNSMNASARCMDVLLFIWQHRPGIQLSAMPARAVRTRLRYRQDHLHRGHKAACLTHSPDRTRQMVPRAVPSNAARQTSSERVTSESAKRD